jgi:hypothetical protein
MGITLRRSPGQGLQVRQSSRTRHKAGYLSIREQQVPLAGSDIPAAAWRKARKSVHNGACVEVAMLPGIVAVRDSKDPSGPVLSYEPAQWRAFLDSARSGAFDLR